MGLITTFLMYLVPGTGCAIYLSLRLGPQLPEACRIMGQRMGLCYYTFKALLKLSLPKDIVTSNEMIKLLRQSEQQANALNRELKQSFYKIKQDFKQQVPDELRMNPYKMLQANNYRRVDQKQNPLEGSLLINETLEERRRLRMVQEEKSRLRKFMTKL